MTEEREKKFETVLSKRQPSLTLVFENIIDPHNISAVLRTADSVGVLEVFVIYTADIKSTKLGKRSSASARKWVKSNYFNSVKECMNVVCKKYDQVLATHLGSNAKSVYETDLTVSTALVFGNEHEGISDDLLKFCNGNIVIPQVGLIQSLNISVACAVILYEAFRQRSLKGMYDSPQLSEDELGLWLSDWKHK